jgi:sulfatase maturation enzyme AslB (radical SAM superfamily)
MSASSRSTDATTPAAIAPIAAAICGSATIWTRATVCRTQSFSRFATISHPWALQPLRFRAEGEPMIHKGLPEAVRRLGQSGVRIGCLSNGSNLQGPMAEAFSQYGTWVRISLDAWDDASYSASRKIKIGQFSSVMRNIRMFQARKSSCTLGVSFIVTPDNAGRVYDVCSLLKDAGVHHVKLSPVITSNDSAASNDHHAETRAIAAQQIERARRLVDDSFAIIDHYHQLEERFEKPYTSCLFARFLTVIGADAGVYACQDKAYTASGFLGSIADRSFRDFWFSGEAEAGIAGLNPSKTCKHHCVANAKNRMLHEFVSVDAKHAAFV